jgi:hypothetical protein
MPRDGSGIYTRPPGTNAVADTTIESTKYNANVADVEADLNAPRPIVAGGTGATSAAAARTNLQAEVAKQIVTNYDTHPFEAGSFYSAIGATNAPVAGHSFAGVIHGYDTNNFNIEARDMNDTVQPGRLYVREKKGGVWGAWYGGSVSSSGGTMTGNLTISKSNPSIILNDTGASPTPTSFSGARNGLSRWNIWTGNGDAEGGSNTGSNFAVYRYSDAGAYLGNPLLIARDTGKVTLANQLLVQDATSSSSLSTGAIVTNGGLAVGHVLNVANAVKAGVSFTQPTVLGGVQVGFTGGGSLYGISTRPQTAGYTITMYIANSTGVGVGSITQDEAATAFNTTSDERLKEDLKSFDAGNIIDDTNVYDFAWKATGERSYGIIAQQAQAVYPTAVAYIKEQDWWGIDYSKYVPVILQELKALRARVAELEGRTDAKPS